MCDQRLLHAPRIFIGQYAHAPSLVGGVKNLTKDVGLPLPGSGVADAH